MKKIFVIVAAAMLLMVSAEGVSAQTTKEEFASRYAMLAGKLGYDGLGIETLITKWEAAFPDDVNMLIAKYNYYLTKSRYEKVEAKDREKFMGEAPVLSLKDSTGRPVNYFREVFFEDEMYGIATAAIDKAIRLSQNDASLRFNKIEALIAYEKESPDMATASLKSLLDYNCNSHPSWTWGSEPFTDADFLGAVTDFCYVFFKIGSPASYESFRSISEKILAYYPKNEVALNNLGTYYMVAKKDYKTALKYYDKTLKIDKDNYGAAKNAIMVCRKTGNTKLEKKYLKILAQCSPDQLERDAANVRLEALK